MPRKHHFESPALQHLYDRYIGKNPEQEAAYEESRANAQVARAIYDLRTRAKLTQAALAKLIHTSPSVISRLEDANYAGHSLAMLRRIAAALDRRLEIRFRPRRQNAAHKKTPSRAVTKKGVARRKTGTR
jgi:ribosome-binding protein aMBF1 (putative translation factor)